MARRLLFWSAFVLLCMGGSAARVVVSSRTLLREGELARQRDDLGRAVAALGQAALMYTPGNPYSARALHLLLHLAGDATRHGDRMLERRCLREARSAILANRSFYTPYGGLLREIDAREAALPAEYGAGYPAPGLAAAVRARQLSVAPNAAASVVLLIGAALLLSCAAALILQRKEGRGKQTIRGLLMGCLGFVLFLLGLWKA